MKFVREFNQFMFKRVFSLFDYIALVLIGYAAGEISLWFLLAYIPAIIFSVYMETVPRKYND